MGQHEVIQWLSQERKFDKERFFTVKEIASGLRDVGMDNNGDTEQMVRRALKKLVDWGQVEIDFENEWRRAYRLKA